jgi:hypothetical protein
MPEPLPLRRVVLAFLAAPAAIAIILGIAAGLSQVRFGIESILFYGVATAGVGLFVVAYPLTLVVGVPAYLLLRRRTTLTIAKAIVAGALVAGVPFSLLLALGPARKLISGMTAAADLEICATVFIAGALTGLVFGLVALGHRPLRG